jgi:hypothetical protein
MSWFEQRGDSPPYRPEAAPRAASGKRAAASEPESPPFRPDAPPRRAWTQAQPQADRSRLAPIRPPFVGPMGRLPPVPPSTLLVEDVLTGKAQSTELSQELIDALFNDNSDQALRP